MRKVLILMLIGLLTITGCSSDEPTKTEDQIRAEVKAELEAENAAKESQSTNKENENIEGDDNTSGDASVLTFKEVYRDDLLVALDYYKEQRDQFTNDEREAFASSIINTYEDLVKKPVNGILLSECPDPDMAFAMMGPGFDDGLYDFYDYSTMTLDLNYFKTNAPEVYTYYKALDSSEMFTLAASLYSDMGNVSPSGFVPVLKPSVYEKFSILFETSEIKNDRGSIPYMPNMIYEGIDSVVNSSVTYPNVLMDDIKDVKALDKQDTFKTVLYLPVIFSEMGSSNSAEGTSVNDSQRTDVFYGEALRAGTKVSDKFTVVSFASNELGYEGVEFELSSSAFVKGTLYGDGFSDTFFFDLDEPIFDKKVILKNTGYLEGIEEVDFNVHRTFAVEKKDLILPPEYVNFVSEGGELTGTFYVKSLTFENTPMETLAMLKMTEVKLTDDEIQRLNHAINGSQSDIPSTQGEIYDASLSAFTDETLYSIDEPLALDYSQLALAVIPMQTSINEGALDSLDVAVTRTGNENNFKLTVLGSLYDVKLEYIENGMVSTEPSYSVALGDEITNTVLNIKAILPYDGSSIRVTGSYKYQSGLEGATFSLDDMRDTTSYGIFTVDLDDLYANDGF